jgi:DNA-binding NtrC family response regulator
VREVNREAGFFIVTGHGTVETAVEALKAGADDYILKPLDLFELRDRVHQILEKRRPGNELRFLRRQITTGDSIGPIIGKSQEIQRLLEQIATVAPTRSTVLLLGESGTGKDLAAQTIHARSLRSREHYLPLNCAALSSTLLESELFGREGGLYRRVGRRLASWS